MIWVDIVKLLGIREDYHVCGQLVRTPPTCHHGRMKPTLRQIVYIAGGVALFVLGCLAGSSFRKCPECPVQSPCPICSDYQVVDEALKDMETMSPDERTEAIALLLEECAR